MGKRTKVNLFLLEISTAENCSRAGGDLKRQHHNSMKVIFILKGTTVNSTCVCTFSVQNMYLLTFMFVKNSSIERLLVAGPTVHSVGYPVTDSRESVKGCKNKARTHKTLQHPPVCCF